MSVSRHPWGVSNPRRRIWVITVIAVITVWWPPAAEVISAYADAGAVLGLLLVCGTAAEYSSYLDRRQPAMPVRGALNC